MQVAKWGHSMAVRLSAAAVDALELKEGDDIDILIAGSRSFEIKKKPITKQLNTVLIRRFKHSKVALRASTKWLAAFYPQRFNLLTSSQILNFLKPYNTF